MPNCPTKPIDTYIELASPQFIEDTWRELSFDLTSGQNMLQDLLMPESGGGHVYKDAHVVGSATHNRFIYWRTVNDILELVEVSTEAILDSNQVKIRFANSPIINTVTIIESYEHVVIVVATLTSVHRLCLPHPKATDKSILGDLTPEILLDPSNYHVLCSSVSSNSCHPIYATAWLDKDIVKSAVSFPNSSILVIQFAADSSQVTTSEIKQVGIIGRLWSRMPNLLAKSPHDCDNAVFINIPFYHASTDDYILFTLCRDCKIRIFSTSTRECLYTHNLIPQSSFSQSFASHTNPSTELPMMRLFGSRLVVYLTETTPEFILLQHTFEGSHCLTQVSTIQAPNWEKLIDYRITNQKIWSLANQNDVDYALCYLDLKTLMEGGDNGDEKFECDWDFVNLCEDYETPEIKNYVTEIFWRNRFSIATVQKALVGIAGPSVPKKNDMLSLESQAYLSLVNKDQTEAWARFYDYCLQNHQKNEKNIGLIAAADETVVGIVKRSNPSFICPQLMNIEMLIQGEIHRGIDFSPKLLPIIKNLNHINSEVMDDELSNLFAQKIYGSPASAMTIFEDLVAGMYETRKASLMRIDFPSRSKILSGIDYILEQIDLTTSARKYEADILRESTLAVQPDHKPLESNGGILLIYELFRRLVKARATLARDLIIYIELLKVHCNSSRSTKMNGFCEDLYESGRVRKILNAMRSYAVLSWIVDSPIKYIGSHKRHDVINLISKHFRYFKTGADLVAITEESKVEAAIRHNLFMNFLVNGGINYSCTMDMLKGRRRQTLSSSYYVTEIALNFCKLLWPQNETTCFVEYLFTHKQEDYLTKYLDLTEGWLNDVEHDHHFIRACNCILEARKTQAVDLFSRLWMNITPKNLIGRFIGIDRSVEFTEPEGTVAVRPSLIHKYYCELISLFQVENNHNCLVMLINQCLSLIDEHATDDQCCWVNRLRAKLFQSHLELEDDDEAYQTMVMMTDVPLRTNCLRKFIVNHCERRRWSSLLSYPFIDIKNDFIEILNQKAETSDLSTLANENYYDTSYYDLLFAYYVSGDEFRLAAEVMYKYTQRLAQEVPGVVSIRKQTDCLLLASNTLRCLPEAEAFVLLDSQLRATKRSSISKRSYDDKLAIEAEEEAVEPYSTLNNKTPSRLSCQDLEVRYELTQARLKLLEKDQAANAIALSPLEPEETVAQLVSSSMFPAALDLAILLKTPIESTLEGLTAKYIFIMNLSSLDIAVNQDLERELTDIFTNSYTTIDTYNYITNSTSPLTDKLWRLIDYYLTNYDGISHLYSSSEGQTNSHRGASVLMRAVASKLLSAGYSLPASLKKMYMGRNTPELLRLLIKYDHLLEAADLVVEMIDRTISQSDAYVLGSFASKEPPPVYLPTHLILLLISYLKEDATLKEHMRQGELVNDRLDKFRHYVKAV